MPQTIMLFTLNAVWNPTPEPTASQPETFTANGLKRKAEICQSGILKFFDYQLIMYRNPSFDFMI